VKVHALQLPGRAYVRERAAITTLCQELQPTVVHTHGYRPDILDAPVARRGGAAIVTTVHGFTGGDWKNRFYEWLQVRAYRRFDAVVAVSTPLVERLRLSGLLPGRLHLVRNAWSGEREYLERAPARAALGITSDEQVIGWIGRLSAEKGPDIMIEGLARLPDAAIRLSLVGEGPLEGVLRAQSRNLGVADRVRWHGLVPDVARLYRAFDVLVLSSRTEGTPIVLLEAMGAGVPVVATSVGGVPDVISPAEAVLAAPNDSAALAQAIGSVLADPTATQRRVEAARERLKREFAIAPWLERYEAVYEAATASRRRA
jgi:glycosyltransferase involved in cell wall biosynthesis